MCEDLSLHTSIEFYTEEHTVGKYTNKTISDAVQGGDVLGTRQSGGEGDFRQGEVGREPTVSRARSVSWAWDWGQSQL